MISHQYNCVFIHIFKCAGSSIERAFDAPTGDHRGIRTLQPLPPLADLCSSRDNCYAAFRRLRKQRYRISTRKRHLGETLTKEQFENYFKFTIVRNPWARAFSYFRWIERRNRNKSSYTHPPFDVFLKRFLGKRGLRPQTYWLKDFSGSIPMDFIGRFESLHDDFNHACSLMGRRPAALPHEKRGEGEDYRAFYTEELNKIIEDFFREEIALFDYNFENG